ncbi:hypothetical protein BH23BAC3_BH23BAC3_21560 [soil metagenome]
MRSKLLSVVYLTFTTAFFLTACDSSSLVSGTDDERVVVSSLSIKMVIVTYGTPFGPEYVQSMNEGSVKVEIDFNPLQEPEKLSPSPFGCIGSMPNRSPEHKYINRTFFFYFEDDVIEESKGRYQHINWRALSEDAPNGETAGIWRCIVPLTKTSEHTMAGSINHYFERKFPELDFTTEVVTSEYQF